MIEEEAISRLNKILEEWQKIVNIEDEDEREIEMSLYLEDMPFEEIKTVLQLLEQKDKRNNKLKYIKAEVEEIIKQHKINELYEEDELLINKLEEHDSNFKSIDNNLKKIKNYIDILEKILEE